MPQPKAENGKSNGDTGDSVVRIVSTPPLQQPPLATALDDHANDYVPGDANNEEIGVPGLQHQNHRQDEIFHERSPTSIAPTATLTSMSIVSLEEGKPSITTPKTGSGSPSVFSPACEAEIKESSSELSSDDQPLNNSNSSIRNFFYPSRQSSLQTTNAHRSEGENVGDDHRDDRDRGDQETGPTRRKLRSNNTHITKSSIPTQLSPVLNDNPNSYRSDDHFEDEHDATNTQSPRRNISSPLSVRSSLASPGGSVSDDDTAAAYVTQERQDKAFVEKFWTAYDEILILSLFTQVGILCRLGAAYWFRYFDNVFQSDSALFTNLPLNCLSCFVMGLLCSGESLMQIIVTRFTPPRLQRDLHREASQQLQQLQEDELNEEHFFSEESDDEGNDNDNDNDISEIRTSGMRRRGWRRRRRRRQRLKRSSNEGRQRMNRSSSLLQQKHHQQAQNPDIFNELREIQLLAWERRIRASVCLLLFPVKKEDVDIVENYFSEGYQRERSSEFTEREDEEKIEAPEDDRSRYKHTIDNQSTILSNDGEATIGGFNDLILEEEIDDRSRLPQTKTKALASLSDSSQKRPATKSTSKAVERVAPKRPNSRTPASEVLPRLARDNSDVHPEQGRMYAHGNVHISARQYGQVEGGNIIDYGTQENPDLDQIISNVATGVSNNISFIGRVNLANGWDVGTSPQEKSEDLTLGLRDGLCGALSSFSSWISSMVNLFRAGQIGQAFVGLMLGIQLPLVAYRFGQYVSVYIFVWRCRREKGQDEKRGYGIQLHTSDEDASTDDIINSADFLSRPSFDSADDSSAGHSQRMTRTKGRRTVHDEESDVPSIRAIFTALFIMCLVAQLTSLTFFKKPEERLLALSLLFSPLGVLARWRMMKLNSWRPSFPLGTFACNVTACALSGTLGSLLAGNPGPRERIALVSIVAGFGGTLSSVARFIVEILSLMDPILFRLDGVYYAIASVGTGLLVSFCFAASVDWADSVE